MNMDKESLSIFLLSVGFAGFIHGFYHLGKLKKIYKNSSEDEYSYILRPEALRIRRHVIAGILVFLLTPMILVLVKYY